MLKKKNFNVFCYFNDLVIFQHDDIQFDELIAAILILIF